MQNASIACMTANKTATKLFLSREEHERGEKAVTDHRIMLFCERGDLIWGIHITNLSYSLFDYKYLDIKKPALELSWFSEFLTLIYL
jgi:hypothetical protein